MQRKMELVRDILLEIEKQPNPATDVGGFDIAIEGYTEQQIRHHLNVMHKAGLIDLVRVTIGRSTFWKAGDITWYGYDFLENIRDRNFFEKAKKLVREQGKPLTIEALKLAFSELIKAGFSGI